MKLSKLLVSVNVAATIPMVVQAAAGATELKVGGTADWLKDSISTLDKPKVGSPTGKAASIARAVGRAKKEPTTLSDGHSAILRPFVPNRRLPRRSDLEMALKAQEPKMAPEPVPTLNGNVSGFYAQNPDNTYPSYGESTPAPRISQNSAVGLRQTKTRPERMAEMTRSLVKAIPMMNQANPTNGGRPINPIRDLDLSTREGSSVSPQRGFPLMQRAEHRLLDTPAGYPTPEDSGILSANDPVMNPNLGSMGSTNTPMMAGAGTTGSAGPPPFPLNLLPEASLKQFIHGSMGGGGGMSRAPHVSFGSWHSNNTYAMAHSLPPGGFHNYAGSFRAYGPSAHRYGSRSLAMQPLKRNVSSSKRYVIAKQPTVAKPAEPKVATYAPYTASTRYY
jgi:hypothetical protein